MNKFDKITKKQFDIDFSNCNADYNDIHKPKRATKFSAGYDFYAPFDFKLKVGETIKIPTGIRCILDEDIFLAIVPRSSLGFKYRLQLDNTVGIIDADYSNSDNEGHIWIKITNDSKESKTSITDKTLVVNKGDAFAQGIIMKYFTTDDDFTTKERNGGIGSTNTETPKYEQLSLFDCVE